MPFFMLMPNVVFRESLFGAASLAAKTDPEPSITGCIAGFASSSNISCGVAGTKLLAEINLFFLSTTLEMLFSMT